jgi:hypothetical protein
MIFRTHCSIRLGDNLQHLQFLRRLAQENPEHHFIHYAHLIYIHQLAEVVSDLPGLQLCDLESVSDGLHDFWSMRPNPLLHSQDAWKNAGGWWEQHARRNEYGFFYVEWFRELSARLKLPCPIHSTEDLRFDYPALRRFDYPPFDGLIINSPPMSGQMPQFNREQFEALIGDLARKHKLVTTARTRWNVPCTLDRCMTVTQIGALSRFCKWIVMVATGPCWPTFNPFNLETVSFRLILNGQEKVDLAPNTVHAENVTEARKILALRNLL